MATGNLSFAIWIHAAVSMPFCKYSITHKRRIKFDMNKNIELTPTIFYDNVSMRQRVIINREFFDICFYKLSKVQRDAPITCLSSRRKKNGD